MGCWTGKIPVDGSKETPLRGCWSREASMVFNPAMIWDGKDRSCFFVFILDLQESDVFLCVMFVSRNLRSLNFIPSFCSFQFSWIIVSHRYVFHFLNTTGSRTMTTTSTTCFQMPLKVGGIVAFQATVNCVVPNWGGVTPKEEWKGPPGCLGYIGIYRGWIPTQVCGHYSKPFSGSLLNKKYNGK